MESRYTHDQAKKICFPLNFDQNKYELLSKTLYMKNYRSYIFMIGIYKILIVYKKKQKYLHFISLHSFHRTSFFMPKWKYRTNFGSFLMKMIFYQGKVNLYNHCAHNKLRLHIILYYEIIIYRLVEGNIIATLSSRGREKSQFFFSITFRNYHVVLWGFDRFLPFIYVPIPQLTMKTCIIECNDKGYQVMRHSFCPL